MTKVEHFKLGPFGNHWFNAYRLQNATGLVVELIDHGATVTRILTPDRDGQPGDILLGCPNVADYAGPHPHFNCLVGRYANRITKARFDLDGESYDLTANIPPHQLHGGSDGLHQKSWHSEVVADGVRFWTHSPDGEAGYPGNLEVEAIYRLDSRNRLTLALRAQTDRATPVSLTSHHYYNLSAKPGSDVLDHEFTLTAVAYLPVSAELTQLGEICDVAGTAFDFRDGATLADKLRAPDEQMRLAGGGFDHHFVLPPSDALQLAAEVRHPGSGRWLRVATDQPGFQLYTANSLQALGKNAVQYGKYGAFCIETQQFPDAPNHPSYPDPTLRPGATFEAITHFEFGVD